ncbi:hypothetical protein KTR66_01665 [Roseococcus sp. SDR]|uniref:hypothetical protein n=1 Tax=Roseococcus sp. SDR TaxID=2835532 RepID=UPI001BD0773F|nr:hypothetical protein [Roseococcus sp. SDR]MBS7788680.1 hypothetical protein [Roseococcus sp. SDR]MBV1843994.1 hypothetical protein [Roseococcus sp. SDR]
MQPGTIKRAAMLGAAILAGVALVASVWPDHRPVTALDTYLRQGPRQAGEALKREVDQLSPRGADPGPAIQRLNALGFSCAAPAGAAGEWNCNLRRPMENRQMLSMEVILRVDRGNVTETSARIWEQGAR